MKFIHASDIHLDSPLRGLERYEGAPVDELRGASRKALENLVRLALDEAVDFVIIAGDVYDGDWKDYNTGLFFARQMGRLREADIPVFLIRGNHDAASQITKELKLPKNVREFPVSKPATFRLNDIGVAIHGQSFPTRAVTEDLSVAYPLAEDGFFNIGVLHTSADGREGHESYAPSTLAQLLSKSYDYWALGHVHKREVLARDPWIVFPGNVQGRHARETGSKGCTLVVANDGRVQSVEHKALDVVRWCECRVDASGAPDIEDVLDRTGRLLRTELDLAEGRLLAARVVFSGACGAHKILTSQQERFVNECRALANDLGDGQVWVEKVQVKTRTEVDVEELAKRSDPLGDLLRFIPELKANDAELRELLSAFKDLRQKLPVELREGTEALNLEDQASLHALLDDAEQILLLRLLEAGTFAMKLLTLDCMAFGCFTKEKLDFSDGRGFHVIYGPNEAGKSTALRALTGLLYGIPAKTPDAFLHDMKELRVSSELERSDGLRFTFVRRKGNRDTLLDIEGRPIPDKRLLDFLDGVSEEVFLTMFRLDHASLLRGGDDLLAGKGDLAESLFEAGTGITGLRQVLAGLDAETDQLFRPRATTALINRSIEVYDAARKQSRELSVPPRKWAEKSAALKTEEEKLQRLKTNLSDLRGRKERLNRFLLALPHVTRRDQLRLEIERLGAVTPLPESAPRAREEAQRREREARARGERAEERMTALSAELEKLQSPEELLAEADAIAGVYERLDSYRKAVRDLPKVRMEQEQLENTARTILSEVKPGSALAEAGALRLTIVHRSRIRTLAAEHHRLQERLRGAADRAESSRELWEQKKRALDSTSAPVDVTELGRSLERARRQDDLEELLRNETGELRAAEAQAAAGMERIPLWSGPLEQVETLPVPTLETVESFGEELDDLANDQKRLETQQEENRERRARVVEEIQTLNIGGAVPTEQDLLQARGHREQGWLLIRRAWLEGAHEPEQERAFDPEQPLVQGYEKSVTGADAVADRLRREADRVAKLAALLAEEEVSEGRTVELETKQLELRSKLEACQKRWGEQWQRAGIVPLSPKEMRGWLTRYGELLAGIRDLRQRRHSVARLQERISEHTEDLNRAIEALGEPVRGEQETLEALIQRCQAFLDRCTNAAQEHADLDKEVGRLAKERDTASSDLVKAQRELGTWQKNWREALAPLGLSDDTRVEEASAVVEKLDELFKKIEDFDDRRGRVREMERHITQFNGDVAALVGALVPELRDLPPDQAAGRLQAFFATSQQEAVHRREIGKQIKQEQKALENAKRELSEAERDLEVLMEKAHCRDLTTLETEEQKSARARTLAKELSDVNSTLAGFTAGATLEAFFADMATIDADRLPYEIEEMERDLQALESERSQVEQQVGSDRVELGMMDGSDQAAAAAEEAQSALASVREHTEHYVRLRLAREILSRHIERYREQNQDPIVRGAGEIFSRLTLGSFALLKTGFDEKDRPVLHGVRPSGEEVEVSGMSDGARDQLFLALRLASLERQLTSSEPLPFVVDDILIKFDDTRAEATLAELVRLASHTQVLFFTHHARLVELARKVAPEEAIKFHRLDTSYTR